MSETAYFLACYAPLFPVLFYAVFLMARFPQIENSEWYYLAVSFIGFFSAFAFFLRYEYGLSNQYGICIASAALGVLFLSNALLMRRWRHAK